MVNQDSNSAASDPSRSPRFLALFVTSAALVAGGLGWVAGEATRETYKPSSKAANEPYAFAQFNKEKDFSDGRNAAIVYGTLGALTGVLVGLVGGLVAGGKRSAMVGAVVGGVVAGLAAAAPCPWVVPLYRRFYDPAEPSLIIPVLIHGAIWAGLGLGVGLGLGLALGGGFKIFIGAIGGFLAGCVATISYDAIVAIVFAGEFVSDAPISPHGPARVLAALLVPSVVALGSAWMLREPRPKASTRR